MQYNLWIKGICNKCVIGEKCKKEKKKRKWEKVKDEGYWVVGRYKELWWAAHGPHLCRVEPTRPGPTPFPLNTPPEFHHSKCIYNIYIHIIILWWNYITWQHLNVEKNHVVNKFIIYKSVIDLEYDHSTNTR